MTVAHIVPLRRLPRRTRWFDYAIPADMTLVPGMAVRVPFMRSATTGIVWQIDNRQSVPDLKTVTAPVSPIPVLHPWQHPVLDAIAADHGISLSDLCQSIVPSFPRTTRWPNAPIPPSAMSVDPPREDVWWYTSRPKAFDQACAWLTQASDGPRLLIVPTLHDLEQYRKKLGSQSIGYIHGALPAAQQRQLYLRILSGEVTRVVGTGRALLLPYRRRPEILIDQEDHEFHVQRSRAPYFDNRLMARRIGAAVTYATPAPSLNLWHRLHPSPPTPDASKRLLGDVGRDRSPFVSISGTTFQALEGATPDHPALIIAPHRNYAGGLHCRDCGHFIACPSCQRPATVISPNTGGRCAFCQHDIALPDTCPHCRRAQTSWTRPGAPLIAEHCRRLFPKFNISDDPDRTEQAQIIIVTQASAVRLPAAVQPQMIVWPMVDRLRTWPDFSADEQAWQALWQMAARYPEAAIHAETYAPEDDFWQRWRHGDHANWYRAEMAARERWRMPPTVDHWIIGYRGPDGHDTFQAMITGLKKTYPGVTVQTLPDRQSTAGTSRQFRAAIASRNATPVRDILPWESLFPPPWTINMQADRWR